MVGKSSRANWSGDGTLNLFSCFGPFRGNLVLFLLGLSGFAVVGLVL